MPDTNLPDTKAYRVTGVGAIYQKPTQALATTGDLVVAMSPTLALRGEEIELVDFEAQRLTALGVVKAADEERSYDEQSDEELEAQVKARNIPVTGSAADGSVRREDNINALVVYDQGSGQGVVGATTVPGGVALAQPGSSDLPVQTGAAPAGAPDPLETSTDDLAKYIKRGPEGRRLNAEETVALAQGDPARAEKVLDAERQATEGDPRQSVEARLKALAEQGENDESTESGGGE